MELLFLGTGAAEGIPAVFCRCPACEAARRSGGRLVRTRCSARLGARCQIDVSPDAYAQSLGAGLDMHDLESVLVTHTHPDHCNLPALLDKANAVHTNGRPLDVMLSAPALDYLRRVMACAGDAAEHVRFTPLDYYREYAFGDLTLRTVKGNHRVHANGEASINYLITLPGGRCLHYACDTGAYGEESWGFLRGARADTLVMECTYAGRTDRGELPADHLDLPSFGRMLDRMGAIGFIDERTSVYATHINPHQGLSHDEICARLGRMHPRATAAYDGLRVPI
jgi:phosphoribosyl 1,2-cyclic phosphate phosphodiesterase